MIMYYHCPVPDCLPCVLNVLQNQCKSVHHSVMSAISCLTQNHQWSLGVTRLHSTLGMAKCFILSNWMLWYQRTSNTRENITIGKLMPMLLPVFGSRTGTDFLLLIRHQFLLTFYWFYIIVWILNIITNASTFIHFQIITTILQMLMSLYCFPLRDSFLKVVCQS